MPRPPGKAGHGRPKFPKKPAAGQPRRRPRRPVAARPAESDQPGDRLQKVLAAAGVASRRECEQLILEGRVEVDGQVVTELGARVDRAQQQIRVDGEPLARPKLQYFAVHKPTGVVSTARDPAGRPRVIDLLPPGVGRMFNVGRLDLASEGLILVTNDGALANRLTHPKHGVTKIYDVQVAGQPEPEVLAQLKRGVHLAEGYAHAVDVRVKSRKKGSTILEMVLDEGRNREVRRLLARVGHKVQRLTRVAVGPIRLGDLPRGAVRALTRDEVRALRTAAEQAPHDRPESSADQPARPAGLRRAGSPRPGSPRKHGKAGRPAAGPPRLGKPQDARRIIGAEGDSRATPPKARPAGRKKSLGGRGRPKKKGRP